MSTEDQELMARIGELAGRINRHKNQQAGIVSAPARPSSHRRTSPAASPVGRDRVNSAQDPGYANNYRRGGFPYGGPSATRAPVHRHRTLVLNGATAQSRPGDTDSGGASDASNPSWVTKTDRHLQLINTSVYEKETQARTRAIEETRRQKRSLKDERERARLVNHMARVAGHSDATPNQYEIVVQGIRFAVAKNGSKLVKVPGASDSISVPPSGSHMVLGQGDSAKATPRMAMVGGVKFYRSKNGNLYRHGIVKAQRYVLCPELVRLLTCMPGRHSGTVKKVQVPCKRFSMTGSCLQGPRCRYTHDPTKVAVCKDFLLQGECPDGDACDLSHDLTPERTPACLHFAKDSCTKFDCRYAHVKVSPGAPVCRSFGIYGYCDKGADCSDRHAFECPDFSNNGVCKTKGCKLPHRERASALRKAIARDNMEDDEMEDVSSDEDGESVDSDDVDSDAVDEFIGRDELDLDLLKRDYIEL
ncbi:hypothetical protein B0T18DRAFT_457656 [Schizothecium vesticola]|uniref:C3H1-type domain-containing protein n=1 Tax=Schizothecium vesticola TaxID=314040 RepID=A0AA40F5U6_9PEZI|nr:hypothetical protein B0T18DRAFT_457656 [Schizothecium vesticola]